MASIIKVDNVQNTPGTNVVSKCGTDITLGASGDTVALACGASQTGFGRTGTVDWVTTVQTGTITAATGKGYFVNTTSGEITANLPAGAAGSIVAFKDYANTWDTNQLIVTPNGSEKIGGNVGSLYLTTESQSITLVYIDAAKGWLDIHDSTSNVQGGTFIVATGGTPCAGATCGDYKIHTFTGPGTLCVSAGSGDLAVVEYIVVAGGGGGGIDGCRAGGGGAGGFRVAADSLAPLTYPAKPVAAANLPVSISPYPITVGGAGAIATKGDNSVFSTITSTGGGKGGGPGAAPSPVVGGDGGSGGGGGGNTGGTATGGTGNTPVVSPAQGFDGGPGGSQPSFGGGGGGGLAVGATGSGPPRPAGAGGGVGGGFPNAFGTSGHSTGGFYYFSGGGGGSYYGDSVPGGVGGLGGGGNGQGYDGATTTAGSAGTTNTGGGGGGEGFPSPTQTAYAGGSGIVIIRYKFQ